MYITVGSDQLFLPWIVLTGLAAGLGSGLFGIGGASILTPLLHVLFGVPLPIVIGTGLCQMVAASTSGVLKYARSDKVDYQVAVMAAGGNLAGIFLGVELSEAAKRMGSLDLAGGNMGAGYLVVSGLFIVALLAIALFIILEKPLGDEAPPPGRFIAWLRRIPPHTRLVRTGQEVSIPLVVYPAVFIGTVSGLLGLGGATFIVPLLIYLVGLPTHVAIATSLAYVFFTGVFGTIGRGLHGDVYLGLAIALMIGSTLGSQFGAIIALRTGARRLRKAFAILMFLSAGMLVWKIVGNLS